MTSGQICPLHQSAKDKAVSSDACQRTAQTCASTVLVPCGESVVLDVILMTARQVSFQAKARQTLTRRRGSEDASCEPRACSFRVIIATHNTNATPRHSHTRTHEHAHTRTHHTQALARAHACRAHSPTRTSQRSRTAYSPSPSPHDAHLKTLRSISNKLRQSSVLYRIRECLLVSR